MKNNLNFIPIIITALVTSAAFLIYINYFQKKRPEISTETSTATDTTKSIPPEIKPLSDPIPWSIASKRIKDYQTYSRPIMMSVSPEDGTIGRYNGFNFETAHLLDLINLSDGTRADSVVFMFGKEGTFIGTGGIEWPHMRIIALPVKANEAITNETLYDKADPCPPYCPSGL